MTEIDTALVDELQEAMISIQGDASLMTAIYRRHLAWSDGTICWCSVKDPSALGQNAVASAEAYARQAGVPFSDVRLLNVRPGDPTPSEGATAQFDGGTLTVDLWGQVSPYTGTATATCVLRR